MASNLIAMASNLLAMATNIFTCDVSHIWYTMMLNAFVGDPWSRFWSQLRHEMAAPSTTVAKHARDGCESRCMGQVDMAGFLVLSGVNAKFTQLFSFVFIVVDIV